MKFRRLNLICECGQPAKSFQSVGFTSEYELVVHWKCTLCGKLAYLVKSLANCCKECPEQQEGSSVEADAAFLQSMGILP